MKKVTAYKCEHCPKCSTNPSALFQHERKCKYNPNNKHQCFEFCKHLKLRVDSDSMQKYFTCDATGNKMFSYKAEHRGLNLEGIERMPLKCDLYELDLFRGYGELPEDVFDFINKLQNDNRLFQSEP